MAVALESVSQVRLGWETKENSAYQVPEHNLREGSKMENKQDRKIQNLRVNHVETV